MIITTLASYKYDKRGSEIRMTIFAWNKKDIIARVLWQDTNNTQELRKGILTFNCYNGTKYNLHRDRVERIKDKVRLNIDCILQHIKEDEIFSCTFQDDVL